jgi:hypothetical protein
MAQTETTSLPAFCDMKRRKIIFLLCVLAAVHAAIFSAAFPFFNIVDEHFHFDLVVKLSQGRLPRSLEPWSQESMQYIVIYSSQEYLWPPEAFSDNRQLTPPWKQPMEKNTPLLLAREAEWKTNNHESSQPPLYYGLAAVWWDIGKWCGIEGGQLLYWLRFLNVFFVAALVWLGFVAARLVFPDREFLQLGVPAVLAFMPQTAFYSINNDILSPLCFGATFVCVLKLLRAEVPGVRLGMAAGLALAATFLAKMTNLPLLAVAFAAVLLKIARLTAAGNLRAGLASLASLFLCAGLPMAAWMAWCKINFGDFTGSAAKIHMLTWTLKPFGEWWRHPIFTPHGLWTFLSGLLATFWQGEFLWHRQPLAMPVVNTIYTISSVGLIALALVNLRPRTTAATKPQREALWFGFWSIIAAIAFLGFTSIIYDFHDCFYPSREHPYFTSGRLMLGALIPFLLLYLYGLDCALNRIKNDLAKTLALAGMIVLMLASEIATDWPVFFSDYNWFHM